MPPIDSFSLILLLGIFIGLLPWFILLKFRRSDESSEQISVRILIWESIQNIRKNWQIAIFLIATPAALTAPLYATNQLGAADLISGILGIAIVYYWHRVSLRADVAISNRTSVAFGGFSIFVAWLFMSVIGAAIAIIAIVFTGTFDLFMELFTESPDVELAFVENTIRFATAAAIFALFSPLLARWVLIIPAIAIGCHADYGRAWRESRNLFIPLALALWAAWVAFTPILYLLDWVVWQNLPYVPQGEGINLAATPIQWKSLFFYYLPVELAVNTYVVLSVGTVSAAFTRTELADAFPTMKRIKRVMER